MTETTEKIKADLDELEIAAKKSKQKKNQKKAAAASPETPMEKVVTSEQGKGPETGYTEWVEKTLETIKANVESKYEALDPLKDHTDLDEMVQQLCELAGYPYLYNDLEKVALEQMRRPHLQALYFLKKSLWEQP